MTWIKRGVHHAEAGGSTAQEPLLRTVWPFADLKLPVSPGLRFLTPEMLLCPGDDTGDHTAQKFLDTCPRSSPTMSVSAEQLAKGVRTPGPQPLTFLYPDCILASGRAIDNHICVVFSHLTTLLNPNGFLSLTTGGIFLGDNESFQLNRTTFCFFLIFQLRPINVPLCFLSESGQFCACQEAGLLGMFSSKASEKQVAGSQWRDHLDPGTHIRWLWNILQNCVWGLAPWRSMLKMPSNHWAKIIRFILNS